MSELSLSPCLFIGIGTNGWQIMDDLRKLVYEEFGVGGLPCFRYVGIETNAGKLVDNSFLPPHHKDYETITPVYITIPDVSVIRQRIDPKLQQEYQPGLREWLDPRLIERGTKSYKAGAGNARHAGRLCLWENWGPVKSAITRAYEDITALQNTALAEKFLREEYFAKKKIGAPIQKDNLISSAPKAYIFGTLCGGTCSGAFIDIAYFVSDLFGVNRATPMRRPGQSEVVGMFTVVDTIRVSQPDHIGLAANCWAALRELDFYFQKESIYKAEFPDNTRSNTHDEPFDTVYLVGMRNQAGTGFIGKPEQGLTQMCAMNLFTEVVAGMAARKDENRVNLRATTPGYLKPNQNGHIRAFSSFGLSAIWYPRYRIARAINRQLGVQVYGAWVGGEFNAANVETEGKQHWHNVMGQLRGSFLGTVEGAHCNVNLPAEVESIFERRGGEFEAVDEFGLDEFTIHFPATNSTFAQRLANPDGDYYRRLSTAENLVLRDLKSDLEVRVADYLRDHTFAETGAYLAFFVKQVKEDEQTLPDEIPVFSQKLDFSMAHDVHNDLWTKLLFMKNAAVLEYKQAVWGDFKQGVLAQLDGIRDHFIKRVLHNVQPFLVELTKRIEEAKRRLETVRDDCETEKKKEIGFQHASNIVPISGGDPESIKDDVQEGAAEILKTSDLLSLRRALVGNENSLLLVENNQPSALVARTDQSFDGLSQKIITRFHIGQEALARLQHRIGDLVQSSVSYVETVNAFKPLTTAQSPNFLFCHDDATAKSLKTLSDAKLADPQQKGYTSAPSPLDHFVIFYQEVPGLAISDLAIADFAFRLLDAAEKSPEQVATHYTHQMGEKMFNLKAIREGELASRWIAAMRYLAPEVFKNVGGQFCLEYESKQGIKRDLPVEKEDAVREYIEAYGSAPLLRLFAERLKGLGKPVVLQRMEERTDKVQTVEERKTIQDNHEYIITAAFG